MNPRNERLFWQVPLTILVCIVASLIAVWAVSRVMGFTMNVALVAALSAILSAAIIAIEVRGARRSTGGMG